ncbi:MAG TPA: hypothetical protein VGL56_03545 [Fimbriimonadaceae bacterium]
MNFLLALVLAVVSLPQRDSQEMNTYGKTPDQIAAMGEDAWNTYYLNKAGDSTPTEENSYNLYATLMAVINDGLAKEKGKKTELAKIRKVLPAFGVDCTEIGSDITQGGTMWNVCANQLMADSEAVGYKYLKGKPSGKHYLVSDVEKQFAVLDKTIESNHTNADTKANFNYKDAKESLTKARQDFKKVVAVASHMYRNDSDLLLGYCANWAKVAQGSN